MKTKVHAKKFSSEEPITLERLERALGIAALAVSLDGAVYLPIFKRMEREYKAALEEKDAMDRAREIAAAYSGQRQQ